jgi:hypothetical protein
MGDWDELKERLVIRFASEGAARTSSPEDLDRFEAESGFTLSDDYREFAVAFGPGTYGRGWQIKAPGFSGAGRGRADLARLYQALQDVHPGLIAFCGKEEFHGWFAWDPEDVTDPVGHDYGVYLLGGPTGGDPDAKPIKVASTFREFVMSFALGQGFKRSEFNGGSYEYDESGASGPISFSQVV